MPRNELGETDGSMVKEHVAGHHIRGHSRVRRQEDDRHDHARYGSEYPCGNPNDAECDRGHGNQYIFSPDLSARLGRINPKSSFGQLDIRPRLSDAILAVTVRRRGLGSDAAGLGRPGFC